MRQMLVNPLQVEGELYSRQLAVAHDSWHLYAFVMARRQQEHASRFSAIFCTHFHSRMSLDFEGRSDLSPGS
jgi:hypothetical protein